MPFMRHERHEDRATERSGTILGNCPGTVAQPQVHHRRRGMHMKKARLTLALVFLLAGTMVHAQGNSEEAHVRSLNNSLLRLHGQLQALDSSQGASIRS